MTSPRKFLRFGRGARHARTRGAYWGGRAPHSLKAARLRPVAAHTARDFLRLALHERGRAALALNLFTHGLLTVLLWTVIWAAGK